MLLVRLVYRVCNIKQHVLLSDIVATRLVGSESNEFYVILQVITMLNEYPCYARFCIDFLLFKVASDFIDGACLQSLCIEHNSPVG